MFDTTRGDYDYGVSMEDMLLHSIQGVWGDDVVRTTDKYAITDYSSPTYNIELKSRRNSLGKYPTTMVGQNKIDYLLTSDKHGVVIFQFTDGLYYLDVSEDNINKCGLAEGGRCDRGRVEKNMYYYVPTGILSKVGGVDAV